MSMKKICKSFLECVFFIRSPPIMIFWGVRLGDKTGDVTGDMKKYHSIYNNLEIIIKLL
jgi:hypothetical protein